MNPAPPAVTQTRYVKDGQDHLLTIILGEDDTATVRETRGQRTWTAFSGPAALARQYARDQHRFLISTGWSAMATLDHALTSRERLDLARANCAVARAAVITACENLTAANLDLARAAESVATEARERLSLRIETP